MKQYLLIIYYKLLDVLKELTKIQNRCLLPFLKHPKILNTDETIEYIIKNNCSVSRFGDGEFSLLYGKSIAFQEASNELSILFKEILKTNITNHITCLPYALIDRSSYTEKAQQYWEDYLTYNRLKIYRYLNFKKTYYDALFTRLYMDAKEKEQAHVYFNKVKKVWDNQDVIIVEGEKSRLGIGNDLFTNAKSIKRIIGNSINAFSAYKQILNYITKNNPKNSLFLLALGPTATALAFDLSKLGYWAIDIGHIDIEYEWMQMGATEKVSVKNKFVGDTFMFDKDDDNISADYNKQIIKII